jgi:hypothetical protein
VRIDTTSMAPEDAADRIITELEARGILER